MKTENETQVSEETQAEPAAVDIAAEPQPAEETPPAAAAPAPECKTVEDWATEKGLLPERILPAAQRIDLAPNHDDPMGSYSPISRDALGVAVNPRSWMFNAAKVRCGWPIGKLVSESEFDKAVDLHTTVVCR